MKTFYLVTRLDKFANLSGKAKPPGYNPLVRPPVRFQWPGIGGLLDCQFTRLAVYRPVPAGTGRYRPDRPVPACTGQTGRYRPVPAGPAGTGWYRQVPAGPVGICRY